MRKYLVFILFLFTGISQASEINIYGVVDMAIRYSTNHNAKGDSHIAVSDGPQTGSRLGFKASEDLSNGMKAFFVLESGFSPSNGHLQQGGRMFGRQSLVGLQSNSFGVLSFGRQVTLGAEMVAYTDIYLTANTYEIAGTQLGLTGLRWDNSLRYGYKIGNFKGALMASLGESSGNSKSNAYGTYGNYTLDKANFYGFYQEVDNTQDGVPGSKLGINQKMHGLGMTYNFTKTKILFSYFDSKLSLIDQSNKIINVGLIYNLTSNIVLKGSVAHEKQENKMKLNGTRTTYSGVASYLFSKRTEVYLEADHTALKDKYSNMMYNFNNSANPNKDKTYLSLGLKHNF